MDINMEPMSGIETASEIREYEEQKHIEPRVQILGVTGHDERSMQFRQAMGGQGGFNDCATKPLKFKFLEQLVKEVYGFSP